MPEKQPEGHWLEVIDGTEYHFEQWGAQRALEVGMQLSAVVAQPLEALGNAVQKTEDGEDEIPVAEVIGALFKSMGTHRKDAIDVVKNLATTGVRRIPAGRDKLGPVSSFDQEYRGRLLHLQKVVKAAAEVQFGDFFGEIMGALAAAKLAQQRRKAASSPPAMEESPSPA